MVKKINENQLRNIVSESVRRTLNELYGDMAWRNYDDWRTREPEDYNEPDPDFYIDIEDGDNAAIGKDEIEGILKTTDGISSYDWDGNGFVVYCSYDDGPDGSEYEEGGRYPRGMRNIKSNPISMKNSVIKFLESDGIVCQEF